MSESTESIESAVNLICSTKTQKDLWQLIHLISESVSSLCQFPSSICSTLPNWPMARSAPVDERQLAAVGVWNPTGAMVDTGFPVFWPPSKMSPRKKAKPVPAERVNLFEKRSKIMKMHFDIIVSTIPWIIKDWAQPWIYCHCLQIHNHCVHDVAMT